MTLDALYGPGTLAALTTVANTARPGAVITQSDTPQGCYVIITWGTDICKMDCTAATVWFTYLSTTCAAVPANREVTNALYTSLCAHLAPALKARGILRLVAAQYDAASTATLMSIGGFVPQGTHLEWVL